AKQCRNGRARPAAEVAGLGLQRGSTLRLYRRPGTHGQRGLQEHSHQAALVRRQSANCKGLANGANAVSATLYEKLSFDFIRDILFAVPTRGRALVTTVSQGALAARALTRPSGMASSGLAGRDRRATRGLRSP